MGKRRCVCRVFWEKTSLGRPRHRWKCNIKISKRTLLEEKRVDCIGLAWNWNNWWAVMYAGINSQSVEYREIVYQLKSYAFQEGLSSIELVDWLVGWLTSESFILLLFKYLGHFVNCPHKTKFVHFN